MQSKHTPGPWRAKQGISQMTDKGTTIFFFNGVGVFSDAETHGDQMADARLIAAAPELLAGIHEIMKDAADCPETLEEACLGLIVCKCRKLIERVEK